MKVRKENGKIIFEIPAETPRYNPYMEEESEQHLLGNFPTLTGLIGKDEYGNEELGWANTIDMDYKGKDDQVGDYIVKWWGSRKEFDKICKEIGVGIMDISYLYKPKETDQ